MTLPQTTTDTAELSGLAGWAVDLMESMGAVGAGLAIAAENVFPPLPSEIILPVAGFTASHGGMSLPAALVWTTLGSVVGALVWYAVGAAIGRDRTRAILTALPLIKITDVDRTEAWFDRHGPKTVFFGRMIPIFRSFISVPAGVSRMSLPSFLVLTTLGSLIWNAVFVLAGYQLGENWHRVEEYSGTFQKGVIAVVAAAVLAAVTAGVVRWNRDRGRAAPGQRTAPGRRRRTDHESR
ncbi:membrane protein DedA with SNARE-associated domain [Haloactinopolyspora alba]|uniref:Membrane protein DedA with SNARE-associated domain n=1 Tax=Haloactinopolyspora alba TaxID=648780 RepID=A0A2P8E270_9ACTN|nr:DedA family protein [Haloactinopolyspora alba]PSL03578.1 membrane protein DedA with SNARE-associated domain [Haloactinopolyspora alba]